MSSTVSDGSAEAIEYGTSTLVTLTPCFACALRHLPPRRPAHQTGRVSFSSRGGHLSRQAEVDVLARDLDLLELLVAERGEAAQDARDQLLGGRGAGRDPDRLVPAQQVRVESALPVDQLRVRTEALRHLDQALRVRARLRS